MKGAVRRVATCATRSSSSSTCSSTTRRQKPARVCVRAREFVRARANTLRAAFVRTRCSKITLCVSFLFGLRNQGASPQRAPGAVPSRVSERESPREVRSKPPSHAGGGNPLHAGGGTRRVEFSGAPCSVSVGVFRFAPLPRGEIVLNSVQPQYGFIIPLVFENG